MKHRNTAWAVRVRVYSPKPFLVGRCYVSEPRPEHAGCQITLFETRKAARELATQIRDIDCKARAVRVLVTVSEARKARGKQ